MKQANKWYKNNSKDKIWWLNDEDSTGEFVFSFDKQTVFNMFADYPHKLTEEEKAIFNRENPYWAEFFSDRK